MTDERFERILGLALRELAGPDASPSLRASLAAIPAREPDARTTWFAGPLRWAAVAVTALAVTALAIVLVPRPVTGPPASSTEEPSASPHGSGSAGPTASLGPSVSPSIEPSARPTSSESAAPSSMPPEGEWSAVRWTSTGVLPPENAQIMDVVGWHGRYVAIGITSHRSGSDPAAGDADTPAFFTSADGLHWALAQELTGCGLIGSEAPNPCGGSLRWLVPVSDGLLAVTDHYGAFCGAEALPCGIPTLWHTTDGRTWSQLSSAAWSAAWNGATLLDVASGPAGVVAVGTAADSAPVVLHSKNARTWTSLGSNAVFARAVFRAATGFSGGFVIVGRTGTPDAGAADTPHAPWGTGRPAAWWSSNGTAWEQAFVGTTFAGAELSQVGAGAKGLFALGSTPGSVAGTEPMAGWASTDGRTWLQTGQGLDRAFGWQLASDGSHIVTLARGLAANGAWTVGYWSSSDGRSWVQLSAGRPTRLPDPNVVGYPWYTVWVVPGGFIQSTGGPVGQVLQFATAVSG